MQIANILAEELQVQPARVEAVIGLLDDGATVPFIARYRKEVTGAMDDGQLRQLDERLGYLRELVDRKQTVMAAIDEQGKLTPELKAAIETAMTKTRVEDIYLPYKKKRKTKGQIAIAAGLAPLAEGLMADPMLDPQGYAEEFVDADKGVADIKAALDGAKYILMEQFAEDANLLNLLRERLLNDGVLKSTLMTGKETEGAKFKDYFDYEEPLGKVPSHRALAVFRGRNEGVLGVTVDLPFDEKPKVHPLELQIARYLKLEDQGRPADSWLKEVVKWTFRVKLHSYIETDLLGDLRARAEKAAIAVFADNLKDLLLAAPAGAKTTLALDPGIRTGCKLAVVDGTGKVLDHATIYPHQPRNEVVQSCAIIAAMVKKYQVSLIAIGNGTASRETERLAGDVIKQNPEFKLKKVVVSEAGASVYSASEVAANELPDLDVTIRGAVSIARRLQDPLAELVKIEPKAIGVGQYQHDVNQSLLTKSLASSVEDCVNAVGVDVNMASPALLSHVSGLNRTLANNIVAFRNANGAFRDRRAILDVPRFGEKAFEQAAGFLRILNGENPLDASAVHPESYAVVENIARTLGVTPKALVGDSAMLEQVNIRQFVTETCGELTLQDILDELKKPGRDPRPEFKTADFKEGVETLQDLKPEMILQGTVTNVTAFGAFVDIGVHQDGLVHISALSESFVKDPRDVVKAGDIVKVKVLEVDIPRKRIALTCRLNDKPAVQQALSKNGGASPAGKVAKRRQTGIARGKSQTSKAPVNTAFADAFSKAKKR